MDMVYKWREGGGSPPVSPQVAGEALEAIGAGNIRSVTPQQVVDAARPDDHPLHAAFEWDDSVAAEAYRRQEARGMIGALVTVMPEQKGRTQPVRAFVSVRTPDESQSYVPIRVAMSDAALREQVLAGAMRELVAWRRRYAEFQELATVFAQIDMFPPPKKK